MRVLLDECVPKPLKKALKGPEIRTVAQMGWTGKRNGQLLALMQRERFSVLITIDKNLHYQQNLDQAGVSVLLLNAGKNRYKDLMPLLPKVNERLSALEPGKIYIIKG